MVLTLLLRGAVPLSPISLVNLDASNAIQPPAIAIQPSILTIPSKTLYLLANPMLIFFMFFTQSILPSNRSPLRSALCVSAFSFLPPGCHPACPERSRRERSEGSAFRLSPIRALSLNGLNSRSPLPFNIPTFKPSNPQPTLFSRLPVPNPFTIRISAKRVRNPCRMPSFKTQDLKPFRMCSCEKTGRGEGAHPSSLFGGIANPGCPLRGSASRSQGSRVTNPAPFVPHTQ
jgi:hypothetical protein